jgi:hypothetical protein
MVFCSFSPILKVDLGSKVFLFFPKIRQGRLKFMSDKIILHVGTAKYSWCIFHINAWKPFANSPYTLKYFWCIQRWLRKRETILKPQYSPYKLKYMRRFLHVCFISFSVPYSSSTIKYVRYLLLAYSPNTQKEVGTGTIHRGKLTLIHAWCL